MKKLFEITVTFANGRKAIYTTNIMDLLTSDPEVTEIMDNQTGEILYIEGGRNHD